MRSVHITFKNNKYTHMKSNYKIISEKNLIIETLSNKITTTEYSNLKIKEFQDQKFNRKFNLITDLSNFDEKSEETIKNLFIVFKENKGKFIRSKSALVITNNNLLKTVNKIIKNDKKISKEIKSFKSIEDAQKWVQK